MLKYTALAMILIAPLATAEIYQWTDTSGKIHYSDTIPKDGKTTSGIKRRDESNLPGITTMDRQEYREPLPENYSRNIVTTNSDADFNTCAEQKRYAVRLEKKHEVHRSEEINAWLWQNCRSYSNDLRKIEQEMM